MAKIKKSYAIYGDDDQSKLAELLKLEGDIQDMVDVLNRETMKNRQKDAKKNNKIHNTTKNAIKVENVSDVKQGTPEGNALDIKSSKKEDKKSRAEAKKQAKLEAARRKAEAKAEKASSSEKSSPLGIIIIVILLLVLAAVGYVFRNEIAAGAAKVKERVQEILPHKEENIPEPNIDTTTTDTVDINEKKDGYIQPNTKAEYTLTEALQKAGEMSVALSEYYTTLKNLATDSLTKNIDADISDVRAMVNSDMQNFLTYNEMFAPYEYGNEYFSSLQSRYENLHELLITIKDVKSSEIYNYINKYIRTENEYMAESKDLLIKILEAYNIEYEEVDNIITFHVN